MITDLDKYRVEIFKLVGLGMMAPFGRLFLEPITIFKGFGLLGSFFYCIMCVSLAIVGVILILKGYDIIDTKERQE